MCAWSVLGCFAPLCVLGKLAGVVVGAVQGCPRVYRIGVPFGGMLGLVSQGPRFAEGRGAQTLLPSALTGWRGT